MSKMRLRGIIKKYRRGILVPRNTDGSKACTRCGFTKTLKHFHKCYYCLDGRHSICKICRQKYGAGYLGDMRLAIIRRLGNKCTSKECRWLNADGTLGCTDTRLLQIDHIFGGGRKDKYQKGVIGTGSAAFYGRLYRMNDKELHKSFQALCCCCNWIKYLLTKVEK